MNKKNNLILSYNETSWIVYLGLGILYSSTDFVNDQLKLFVERIVQCIQE